jgi:dephospho-CoA kinase
VIGLVGGIGAGKSSAAARLEELGAMVLDADKVGHALLDQRPVRERVVSRFGREVLVQGDAESEPVIDRRALGAIVFADPAARKALEAIVHPWMRRTFEKAIARTIRKRAARAVVLDAAVLFEAGWDSLCDRVLFVDAPREQRLARLSAQRGWDVPALDAREKAQWPLAKKRERSDLIALNDGSHDDLRAQVDRAWASLHPRPSQLAKTEDASVSDETRARRQGSRRASPRDKSADPRPRGSRPGNR